MSIQRKCLMWGMKGWIGSMLKTLLEERGYEVIGSKSRLEDYCGILRELEEVKPDYVINVAGITGRPTVDWCESNKADTYLINVNGTVNLTDACWRKGIHITYYGTGCIYAYDETHPIGTKFTETDAPNFRGSTYSISKTYAEDIIRHYDNVLILRIRLPVSDDLHPKSLVSKLIKYNKVVDIPNSITILPELLPVSINMMEAHLTGIYNFTNPGSISHNEILKLYQQYIDSTFTWSNFTLDEQNACLQSKRSNCYLDTSKLEHFAPVTEVHTALSHLMQNMKRVTQS